MPKPYFETENGVLYHGDCLEILPHIEITDLALTDPPYGIGERWVGGVSENNGWSKTHKEKSVRNEWDSSIPDDYIFKLIINKSINQIVWGGNYFNLKPSRCWLVWSKPERGFTLSEAELAWTSFDNVVRVFDGKRHIKNRLHPTQKPYHLILWCLSLNITKKVNSVLDPFFGSGTVGLVCERLKKKWI